MFQNEKVVEIKTCKHCNTSFEITDKDLEFYEKVSPVFGGKKYNIPTPTLCPDCRQQRRLSFRNERKLYKRKCDATGKDIISIYSPDKQYKVYEQSYWWSDKWEAMNYGIDFDFSKSFFEQFGKLMKDVPYINLFSIDSENSEFCNYSNNLNSCYLCYGVGFSNSSLYIDISNGLENCVDCSYCVKSSESYEIVSSVGAYKSYYSIGCKECSNLFSCYGCVGSKNCVFSTNLVNKEYYIFNKPYLKEDYFVELGTIFENKDSYIKKYHDLLIKTTRPNLEIVGSESCIGDVLLYSKNSYFCYDSVNIEECKYITNCGGAKNCLDGYGVYNGSELSYELLNLHGYSTTFCIGSSQVSSCIYCIDCHGSNNCFGCIGLRNKSYCILNKQYTKEDYEILVPQIIEHMTTTGEWGEFFPSSISPFGYNETVAQEYFPLSKDEALKTGFNWSDYEAPFPKVDKIIQASKLPNDISSIPDDILNRAIECEVTKKPFRIIKQELEFYRKHNLPIPKRHPDQRHLDRMSLRNPRKLFDRKCDKCGKDIKTTYSPDRLEIVYCEECYNKEVY